MNESEAVTLQWTGERYLPQLGGEIGLEHTHRYLLARRLAAGKRVLDIACGEGYGSALLAEVADQVVGVDISDEAVGHARSHYARPNLEFKVGSCSAIPLPDASVDLIASFETIEHHAEHEQMMRECLRVLKPDGLLCISSPDRFEYSEVPGTTNEFHVKELTTAEFDSLLAEHFRHVRMFGQRVRYASMMGPVADESGGMVSFESGDSGLVESNGLAKPLYLLAFASNVELPEIVASGIYFSPSVYPGLPEVEALTNRVRELDAQVQLAEPQRIALYEAVATSASLQREKDTLAARLESETARFQAEVSRVHAEVSQSMAALQQQVAAKEQLSVVLRREVDDLRASTSWKITTPLRLASRAVQNPRRVAQVMRGRFGNVARALYRRMPVSDATRIRLKNSTYARLGPVLKGSASYRAWQNQHRAETNLAEPAVYQDAGSRVEPLRADWDDYVELSAFGRTTERARIERLELEPMAVLDWTDDEARSALDGLVFAECDKPVVSIIVPVFNNLRLTAECLVTLQRHTSAVEYEVIVVDDGSTDATNQVLPGVAGLTYLQNDRNLGFVLTCNRGAEAARGQYVLFLNNDAQVTEGWLSALLREIDGKASVGAVGPRIVYPNGRLQEAGTVLNRDVSATLIGLDDDPALPAYGVTREVDYCSGASLMLRTDLFRQLGGFDTQLAPSYCEDVDLSLKVRKQGLKIMYVADSTIVHRLSATSNSMHRRYKMWWGVRNQQRLAEKWQESLDKMNEVRLISFYLPQFHAIPENDRWWGKGFTEWTNVAKAKPNFLGHQQPLLPTDLGFYDLSKPGVMQAQADLAQRYGIHGFCYYYYWFAGKRLLEAPLERMLLTGEPDLPFCLCWANENWTRRWDGQESEILLGQQHSDADDRAVIADLIRFLRHPNYIRVDGKPALLVYRPSIFPDVAATARLWRAACLEQGVGEIMLLAVESHDGAGQLRDPRGFGFDAAVEFPPHQMGVIVPTPPLINPEFRGTVFDYKAVARRYMQRQWPSYPFYRGVIPRWDNTARRQNAPGVFVGSTPAAYQAWLEFAIEQTRKMHHGDGRLLFINAWNEWAEGAHLEPDNVYGHAYLEATRNALDSQLLIRS